MKLEHTNIQAKRIWSAGTVRATCIRENLYTGGDCDEYAEMLDFVDKHEPSIDALYTVAKNINDHSHEQTISNIMYLLERSAVYTTYSLNGEDDF